MILKKKKPLIILITIFAIFCNSSKSNSDLIKEVNRNTNKIIVIGFYDIIHCDRKWRRIKKGYFFDLPKFRNKFEFVFLAKNGVDSNCYKFTHLKFRHANKYENLKKAVIENKIDIIVQNEDENLQEHKYLLRLKEKYGIKLVQIMHEYYFFF